MDMQGGGEAEFGAAAGAHSGPGLHADSAAVPRRNAQPAASARRDADSVTIPRRRSLSRESRSHRMLRRASIAAGLHQVRLRQRLRVRNVQVPAGLGLRFVIVSDLHADAHLLPATAVRAVVDAVNRVPHVDAVLLPGDFVGHDPAAMTFCAAELARLAAPAFASLGNHDLEADNWVVRAALEQVGIVVLVNDAIELRAATGVDESGAGGAAAVWIGGLDSLVHGDPDVAAMLRALPTTHQSTSSSPNQTAQCVVLGHEPTLATRHE